MNYAEAAKAFQPETAREYAVAGKCKLRNIEKNKEGATDACPCEHPKQCQVIKIIREEKGDD